MLSPSVNSQAIIEARKLFARLALRPVVLFAAGFALGILLSPPGALVAASLGIAWILRRSTFCLAALGFALGGVRTDAATRIPERHISRVQFRGESHRLTGTIREPHPSGVIVEVETIDGTPSSGAVLVRQRDIDPGRVAVFWIRTPFPLPGKRARRGVWGVADCIRVEAGGIRQEWRYRWWVLRAHLRRQLYRSLSPEPAGFLAALVLGQGDQVDPSLQDALRSTGTTHLLVISGTHFLFVFALAAGIARWFLFDRRSWVAALAWTALYGAVVIGSVPVMRALVGIAVHQGSLLARRQMDGWSSLSLAAVVLLAINPLDLFDPSFQLSFAAVAAILASSGESHRWVKAGTVTLNCLLFTAPITAYHFGQIATGAGISNLLLAPMFSALLVCGFFCLLPGVGLLFGPPTALVYSILKILAFLMAELPASAWSVDPPRLPVLLLCVAALVLRLFSSRPGVFWTTAVVIPAALALPSAIPSVGLSNDGSAWIRSQDGITGIVNPRPYALMRRVDWCLITDRRPVPASVRATWHIVGPRGLAPPKAPCQFLDEGSTLRIGDVFFSVESGGIRVRSGPVELSFGGTPGDSDAALVGGEISPKPGQPFLPRGSWARLDDLCVRKLE